MDIRINKLIDFVVLIFVPDLEVAKALIQRLVKIIFELYQNKNFKSIGNVMQDVIQDLGHLFGINPQLLDGIIGILNGDYDALAKMAAPIANIEP